MSDVIYAIVFQGEVLEGHQPISVKAHMAKLLKADADKMAALFSGKQVVLKRTASKEDAIKYTNALKKVGADIKVKAAKAPPAAAPVAKPAAPAASAPVAAAAPAAAPTSNITLAENDDSPLAPPKEVEAVQVDISGISLKDNDDSPLAPPREIEAVQVDISGISVAEFDDAPLAAPSAPVAKVDAPDFGLDEPGAVLETLKVEKQEVNPDISGLSLADAGADLIDESDKTTAPPPKAPDVSKINLVPNFDLG